MSAAVIVDAAVVCAQWEEWATFAVYQARVLTADNSGYDASLKAARAETYRHAVAIPRANPEPAEAARLMMENATRLRVLTSPLIGFDPVGVRYTVARTWQRCARMLDPSIEEVQPEWE